MSWGREINFRSLDATLNISLPVPLPRPGFLVIWHVFMYAVVQNLVFLYGLRFIRKTHDRHAFISTAQQLHTEQIFCPCRTAVKIKVESNFRGYEGFHASLEL